jgi:uncharacterized RDD family membrane protein YckC
VSAGPVEPVPREARSYQGQRAGLVTRLVANIIDFVVVGVIMLAGYGGYVALVFMFNPRTFTFPTASLLLSLTAAFVVAILYLSVGWMTSGRTYGCHVMGLRVVNFRGKRLNPVGALIRAVLCTVFPIGLLWCGGSGANRSLQDVVLRTSVIYDWLGRAPWRQPEDPAAGEQ